MIKILQSGDHQSRFHLSNSLSSLKFASPVSLPEPNKLKPHSRKTNNPITNIFRPHSQASASLQAPTRPPDVTPKPLSHHKPSETSLAPPKLHNNHGNYESTVLNNSNPTLLSPSNNLVTIPSAQPREAHGRALDAIYKHVCSPPLDFFLQLNSTFNFDFNFDGCFS